MEWTREHDRVIAERCEGWTVQERTVSSPMGSYIIYCDHFGKSVPEYLKSLEATIRAAEAWMKHDVFGRRFEVFSPSWQVEVDKKCNHYTAQVVFNRNLYYGSSVNLCEALAWALYKAVTA